MPLQWQASLSPPFPKKHENGRVFTVTTSLQRERESTLCELSIAMMLTLCRQSLARFTIGSGRAQQA
jgi:hypothetical protein